MAAQEGAISPQQKAAAIIISLGSEKASAVYKFLKDDEIEQLTIEIAKLDRLSPQDMQDIITDFHKLCITQKVITEGGIDYAKDVLEKAFGQQTAVSLMERVARNLKTKSFDFLRKTDYKNLYALIQNEHPQTIALILSYASADQASHIIAELSPEKKVDVVKRIATMDRANPDIVKIVEKTLEKKFVSVLSVDLMEVGGVSYVADVMNHVDRQTEKHIFDQLSEKDPTLADEIRKRMFVFEDIVHLDNMSIQRFIRDLDTKDLAVALKGANQDVQNAIFQNMSSRMSETLRTEMEYLHNVRMRDVDEAQQRILAVIRSLEEAGEIVVSKGGKDDVIA